MAQPANLVDAKLYLSRLHEMREHGGEASTVGLDDRTVSRFLSQGDSLGIAIDQAYVLFQSLKECRPDLLALDESQQVAAVQQNIVNF